MSGFTLKESKIECLVKHSLCNDAFLTEFEREYHSFLLSKYGPNSCHSLILNSVLCETLTSSASQILKQIPFNHPCCKFINALIKAQQNTHGIYSLYVGILCSGLLIKCLRLTNSVPRPLIKNVVGSIQSLYFHFLFEKIRYLSYKVNISKAEEVLCVINTVIKSKCSYLSIVEGEYVSIKIVEAFLKTVPSDLCSEIGNIFISESDTGSILDSQIVSGVLYRETDLNSPHFDSLLNDLHSVDELKVILFSIPLALDSEEIGSVEWQSTRINSEESFITDLTTILTKVVTENNITILASQKCIHPGLKYDLSKKGILVLERLGTVSADRLVKISNCCPISSLTQIQFGMADSFIGRLSSVRKLDIESKIYLNLISARECQDVTFVLTGRDPHVAEFLKETINTCINLLQKMLKDPSVIPGGGCFESLACAMLLKFKYESMGSLKNNVDASSSKINMVFSAFADVLLRLSTTCAGGPSANIFDYYIDFSVFHLWSVSKNSPSTDNINDFCACRLMKKSKLSSDLSFISLQNFKNLFNNDFSDFSVFLPNKKKQMPKNISNINLNFKPPVDLNIESVVDYLPSKLNAIQLALNGFSELHRIGICIFDK